MASSKFGNSVSGVRLFFRMCPGDVKQSQILGGGSAISKSTSTFCFFGCVRGISSNFRNIVGVGSNEVGVLFLRMRLGDVKHIEEFGVGSAVFGINEVGFLSARVQCRLMMLERTDFD